MQIEKLDLYIVISPTEINQNNYRQRNENVLKDKNIQCWQ